MKIETLTISREKLEAVTKEAVAEMINSQMSGWKVDILIDVESGEIWGSGKNTNAVYPTAKTLFQVHPVCFEETEYYTEEDCVAESVDWLTRGFENREIGYLDNLEEDHSVTIVD